MRDEDVSYAAAHQADWESMVSVIAAHRPGDGVVAAADLPLTAGPLPDRMWLVNPHEGYLGTGDSAHYSVQVALWDRSTDVLSACTVVLPALTVALSVLDQVSPPTALPTDHQVRIATAPQLRGSEVEGVTYASELPLGAAVHHIICGEVDAAVLPVDPYRSVPNGAYGVAMHFGLIVRWTSGDPVTFLQTGRPSDCVVISHPEAYRRIKDLVG